MQKNQDLVDVSKALCDFRPESDEELRTLLLSSIKYINFSEILRIVS